GLMRQASCPNCGGPIEFKLGSSLAQVCPFCRFSVVRTDRSLEALGRVADLVPSAAELAPGDRGGLGPEGQREELVVGGRLQLDHGQGPWDEYFVELTRQRRWAWMTKSQGRWKLMFPTQPTGPLPSWSQMSPGAQGTLPGAPGTWTVQERGSSTLISAEGELPEPARSGEQGHYVDLVGPDGGFATIDYGDGSQAPKLFVGRVLQNQEVAFQKTAAGPRDVQRVDAARLRCPNCGAPVPILAPDITDRAACASCNSLLDFQQGQLVFLKAIEQHRQRPAIPLGSEGELFGEKALVIGFMERGVHEDGQLFTWREYLLHTDSGYRWLTEDDGHWTYLSPCSAAEVEPAMGGLNMKRGGKRHRLFSTANAHVRYVAGEFYWKVETGQTADLRDFIRPPNVLSEERTASEVVWSVGRYVEPDALWKAFGLEGKPPKRTGVGPCQPNPASLRFGCLTFLALALGLCAVSGVVSAGEEKVVFQQALNVPVTTRNEPDPLGTYAVLSAPFTITKASPLGVTVATSANNQYVGVNGALIDEASNEVREFYADAGYYSGRSGGESWSEGSRNDTTYLPRVPAGTYRLRLDPYWTSFPQPGGPLGNVAPTLRVTVQSGVTSGMGFFCALCLLVVPFLLIFFRYAGFESRRNQKSNVTQNG
ncbi:MAG: DUF4178 domain-containing protein, partial [Myxococcota bacterium]